MPLKFAVIPTKNIYEEYSMSIVEKINNVNNCESELDNNYSSSLSLRILENKRKNKNVIAIGNSEMEHDMILLHFSDKTVRPKSMELDDFISLLESYDEEDMDAIESDNDSDSDSDDGNILDMFVRSEPPKKAKKLTHQSDNKQTKENENIEEEFEIDCVIC